MIKAPLFAPLAQLRSALRQGGLPSAPRVSDGLGGITVNPGKLEHGLRMINAGIPYTLP